MRVSLGANFLPSLEPFTSPRGRFMAILISQEYLLSQIKGAPERLLSVSVKPQMSLVQNNSYAKFCGVAYSDPLKNHEER